MFSECLTRVGIRGETYHFDRDTTKVKGLQIKRSEASPWRLFGQVGRCCGPSSRNRCAGGLVHRQHQLAEVGGLFHAAERGPGVGPVEVLPHRAKHSQRDGLVEIEKILPRSHVNSLNPRLFVEDGGNRQESECADAMQCNYGLQVCCPDHYAHTHTHKKGRAMGPGHTPSN